MLTVMKGKSVELLWKSIAKLLKSSLPLPLPLVCKELLKIANVSERKLFLLPPLAVLDSGVLEISSKDPRESECSADGRFRGGNGDRSVSLVSCARVSFKRRLLRLLFGVFRERSDTDFLRPGLSDCRKSKFSVFTCCVQLKSAQREANCRDQHTTQAFLGKPRQKEQRLGFGGFCMDFWGFVPHFTHPHPPFFFLTGNYISILFD